MEEKLETCDRTFKEAIGNLLTNSLEDYSNYF